MSVKVWSILLLVWPLWLNAQSDSSAADAGEPVVMEKPELNPALKAGVRLGLGASVLTGSETTTASPQLMLTGGAYVRYRFARNWMMQHELAITSKGGSFDNKPGEYGQIRCYFIDAPLLLMYGLNTNNTVNIAFGAAYARLLSAAQFAVGGSVSEKPAINPNDFILMGGAQFHTSYFGIQVMLKYGLLNANRGLVPDMRPLNQGKNLNHVSVDVNFLF